MHDDEVALGARLLGACGRAAQAIAAERTDQRSGDDADAAVAQAIQMVHRLERRLRIVDVHARDAEPRAELAAVDDRRAPRRHRADEHRGLLRQPVPEEDEPISFLTFQHQRVPLLALIVVLRVADEHRVAAALRGVFDALQNEREKRIRDVGHGDEELRRPERPQILRRGVRLVAEAFDRLHHAAPRVGRDDVGLAQHARNGGRGNPGPLRHFVDVRHDSIFWMGRCAAPIILRPPLAPRRASC